MPFSILIIGTISDHFGRINCLFITTFLSGIMSLTVWTTAHNEAAIWVYVVLYGFFWCWLLDIVRCCITRSCGLRKYYSSKWVTLFHKLVWLSSLVSPSLLLSLIVGGTPNHIHGIIWSGLLMAVGGLFCLVLRIQRPVDTLSLKFNFGLLHQKRKGGYTKKIELFFDELFFKCMTRNLRILFFVFLFILRLSSLLLPLFCNK